jgi:hypothetical protein
MLLEEIRKRLEKKITDQKSELLGESVEIELTEEEKEGLTEAECAELLEAKKKMKEEEDPESCDDEKDDDMEDDEEEVDVDESLAKIFTSATLDESIKKDLKVLFNVAVAEAVTKKCNGLAEKYEAEYTEAISTIEENVDKYITFVANEWIKENELQVETGIKVDLAESFLAGMRDLFVENYVDVPEDKVDLVAEAEEVIAELNTKIDEQANATLALQEEITSLKTKNIINEVSSELTETEKEKLGTLIDSIEYKDDSSYKEQVTLVIEKYFSKDGKEPKNEEKLGESSKDPRMAMYLKAYGKK